MGRKIGVALALAFLTALLFCCAKAEVSANLHKKEIIGKKSRRVEESWWENDKGERVFAEDLGWATVRYQYNGKPRCILESYFDAENRPCVTKAGYSVLKQKWDGNGRLLWKAYYDTEENPVTGPEGYHKEENKYDHMKLIRTCHYDVTGDLMSNDQVWAQLQYAYDNWRHVIKAEYLDADLEPMDGPGGYAILEREYVKTEMSAEYFHDSYGDLVFNKERGYAGFQQTYDEKQRLVKTEYFGADGELLMYKGKYAYFENEYETIDQLPQRVRYFDAEGKPAIQQGGWASVAYTYDNRGKIRTASYYNENNVRTVIGEGYSMVKRYYTSAGDIIMEAYYDVNDQMMIHPEKGYAMVERRMIGPGRPRYEAFFDEEGNPMVLEGGYHAISYKYQNKRKTEETYLNLKDKPVNNTLGYATILYEYDKNGRNTARQYLNAEGDPVDGGKGYTRCEISYYSEKPSSYKYFGEAGTPTDGPEGAHELRYRYDEFAGVAEIACFGTDGEKTVCSEGWHRFTQKRDENGRIVEKMYFDSRDYLTSGKDGWAGQTIEYDQRGRTLTVTTYGIDGNPGPVDDTYATVYYQYDEVTNVLHAVYYFDAAGEPVRCLKGCYGIGYIRNETGRVMGEIYLDEQSEQMTLEKGYAGTNYTYSEDGKIIRLTYVDPEGKPVEIGIGYCAVEIDYDEDGKAAEKRFINSKGEVVYTQ